jgi:hypothetical protein
LRGSPGDREAQIGYTNPGAVSPALLCREGGKDFVSVSMPWLASRSPDG